METETAITTLGNAAATIAITAAGRWFREHPELTYDLEALSGCLKANVKIRLPKALHDAREAVECNMTTIATQTFTADMILAGVEAAKEACQER